MVVKHTYALVCMYNMLPNTPSYRNIFQYLFGVLVNINAMGVTHPHTIYQVFPYQLIFTKSIATKRMHYVHAPKPSSHCKFTRPAAPGARRRYQAHHESIFFFEKVMRN